VHIVGFIIRIFHNAQSSECQIPPVYEAGLSTERLYHKTPTLASTVQASVLLCLTEANEVIRAE
jgi:hypothetical protein